MAEKCRETKQKISKKDALFSSIWKGSRSLIQKVNQAVQEKRSYNLYLQNSDPVVGIAETTDLKSRTGQEQTGVPQLRGGGSYQGKIYCLKLTYIRVLRQKIFKSGNLDSNSHSLRVKDNIKRHLGPMMTSQNVKEVRGTAQAVQGKEA